MTDSPPATVGPSKDSIARRLGRAVADLVIGLALVAAGVAGLALPVLPGWIPLFAGVLVIAGRVPVLRAAVDRAMRSGPVQTVVAKTVRHPNGRHSLARLLQAPRIRQALLPATRWALVHRLARSAAHEGGAPGPTGGPGPRSRSLSPPHRDRP